MGLHSRARTRVRTLPVFTAAAAAAMAAAGAAGVVTAAAPASAAESSIPPALASQLSELRQCESSGNYAIDTGNGFYGAYQFTLSTWESLGYSGMPNQAAPATQDMAAAQLESAQGWGPWPACSARLGLYPVSLGATTLVPAAAAAPVTAPVVAAPVVTAAAAVPAALRAPAFRGTVLNLGLLDQRRSDVALWQARMAQRGWVIAVDGYFGPQSTRVARLFAEQKGLAADTVPGQVDAAVWSAAWTAEITPF